MYNAMIQNNVDMVFCGSNLIYGPLTPEFIIKDQIRNYEMRHSGKETAKKVFFSHNSAIWNKLFKKVLIIKYSLVFDEGFASYEDSGFVWSYWCIAINAYFIKEKYYYYLLKNDGIMGKSFRRQMGIRAIDKIKICESFYNFLQKFNIFTENKLLFWDCYLESIYCCYGWAGSDVIREYGIPIIKNFLKGKDISYLTEPGYLLLHCFANIGNKETVLIRERRFLCFKQKERWNINDLSVTKILYFFNFPIPGKISRIFYAVYKQMRLNRSPKAMIKLLLKSFLPYGIVRFIQKVRRKT
jgi:hypothetical protein